MSSASASSQSQPQPDYQGILQKEGGKFMKSNQTRWFELYGCSLLWYKAKPINGEKPQGCLDLRNTRCIDMPKEKNSWSINGPNMKKKYVLIAASENDKKTWMERLDAASTKTSTLTRPITMQDSDEEVGGTSVQEVMVFNRQGIKNKVGEADFEPIAVLGKGAFGKVMKVKKKDTGEIFAMKALNKELIEKENLIEHTMAEKSILERIQHPFIVGLHYAFQTSNKLYLILDLLAGGELFYHLQHSAEGRFDEARARFYVAEIGLALGHVHKMNIIYRDLKPENTVLDKFGHVCLTDFGLAKTNVSECTAQTFCGTPEYLAPEFLMGGGHGKAVDWWSLGILLYEMIAGLPPFYSENVNEMYELILTKPLEFSDEFSPEAQDLCAKLLDRNPEIRLHDVEIFKNHPFFTGIDWGKLLHRELTPPFVPDPNVVYVDSEFAEERARYSMRQTKAGETTGRTGSNFAGFTFSGDTSGVEALAMEHE